jgi:succinyl-diaminopimelate desuccinylase
MLMQLEETTMAQLNPDVLEQLQQRINRRRLLETATQLMEIPSRTGEGGPALTRLADILKSEGFPVKRVEAGHPDAPAVVSFYDSGTPSRVVEVCCHIDTPDLPFVPPRFEGNLLTGSGAAKMKGGIAAAIEAMRALRESGLLSRGEFFLTVCDLHESPNGFGPQLREMINAGLYGDAVLIPDALRDRLPVAGRAAARWQVTLRRPGEPIHEVYRTPDEPDVIVAASELVRTFEQYAKQLANRTDPVAGPETLHVGRIESGQLPNQSPQTATIEGTRRWLATSDTAAVEAEFRSLVANFARVRQLDAQVTFSVIRDAFQLDQQHPFVAAFQSAHASVTGQTLPIGNKPFADDGNNFWSLVKVPAITHGPVCGGSYTSREWVDCDDLVRLATVYALTTIHFCTVDA